MKLQLIIIAYNPVFVLLTPILSTMKHGTSKNMPIWDQYLAWYFHMRNGYGKSKHKSVLSFCDTQGAPSIV